MKYVLHGREKRRVLVVMIKVAIKCIIVTTQ